jgi:hypothetical protein
VESRSALESVVPHDAPVAQLDRACASEAQGRVFESLRAHHFLVHFVFNDFRRYPFVRFELKSHGPHWSLRGKLMICGGHVRFHLLVSAIFALSLNSTAFGCTCVAPPPGIRAARDLAEWTAAEARQYSRGESNVSS